MIWWTVAFFVASLVINRVLRPKPILEEERPDGTGDITFPTATEGRVIPLIWGTVLIEGPNVTWYDNVTSRAITASDVIMGYQFFASMQFALCRGPGVVPLDVIIDDEPGMKRAYVPGTHFFSVAPFNTRSITNQLRNPQVSMQGSFYEGDSTQPVDAILAANQTNPTAHRGTCHCVLDGLMGTSPQLMKWAFMVERTPNGLNLTAPQNEPSDGTINPMNVLYEIMTDTEWGLSISASAVDIPNFVTAAETLKDEGNGFAMLLDREMPAARLLDEVVRQIDGSLWFDRGQGEWRMTLIRDDYNPGVLLELDETNIVDLAEFTRQTWAETTNQVRVKFKDQQNEYAESYALAQDMGNRLIQGENVSSEVTFPGVRSRTLANTLAWRELRTLSYPLSRLTIKINRDAYTLRPGSLFKFSWARLGISGVVYRVGRFNPGKLGASVIAVSAVEDIFNTGVGSFEDPPGTEWTDPISPVVAVTSPNTLAFEAPGQMVKQSLDTSINPRVWSGALDPGGGTDTLDAYTKLTGGSYVRDHSQLDFVRAGTLKTAIPQYATTAARPDAVTPVEVTYNSPSDLSELIVQGSSLNVDSLAQIIKINDEFIGYETAADLTTYLKITKLYRGLFNSPQQAHSISDRVWFVGQRDTAVLTFLATPSSASSMLLQLRSVGIAEETTEGGTPVETVTLDHIYKQPLPLRDLVLNSVYADVTDVSLDGAYTTETGRAGEDAKAILLNATPRSWRVDAVTSDHALAATIPAYADDSPVVEYVATLDPAGTPVPLSAITAGDPADPEVVVPRNDIIIAAGVNANIPGDMQVTVTPKHTPPEYGVQLTGADLDHDFTVASSILADDLTHGGLTSTVAGTAVDYGEVGDYDFDIHDILASSGILEANVDSGGWNPVITAGNTTGTLTTAGSPPFSVELRFTGLPPNGDTFFDITGPTEVGHGVLMV